MLIIDSHLDLSWNACQWNRNLLDSALTIRVQELFMPGFGRGNGTVALPDMRRGRVAVSVATLLTRSTGNRAPNIDYGSTAQAYGVAHGQLAYYRALEQQGHCRVLVDKAGLDTHIAEWQAWEAEAGDALTSETPPLGFVISTEGADAILWPEQLEAWYDAGLRLLGLTHYGPGRYAGGTGVDSGLTDLAQPLLAEMARVGVLLDLTHCSDASFWQALDLYDGPVLASHNNCRALVPRQREFSDDQICAIIERDGVIGVALDAAMLKPHWVVGQSTNAGVTLSTVIDHVDHIRELAGGSTRHIAIGTDLDGGFGQDQAPQDLETIADLQKLPGLLTERDYSEDEIAAICHGNWLRFLREAWGEG